MKLSEKLSNILSETAKSLGKKSSEFVEISKLSLNAQKKQDNIQEKYEKIGEYVYNRLKRLDYVTKEELEPWISEIRALETDIVKLEKMAMDIRNAKYCDYCKVELEEDVSYCPFCGKYLN